MKKTFKAFYKLTEDEIRSIWESGVFIFDTNSLLNLYRYSKETQVSFLNVLNQIKRRIWVPYHVGLEFHNRRLGVINGQVKKYDDVKTQLNNLKGEFISSSNHPFISIKLLKELTKNFTKIEKEVESNKSDYSELGRNDSILEKLTELLKDRVGETYSDDMLSQIYRQGEARFKYEKPPGFVDYKKKRKNGEESVNKNNEYGDYIIWRQILDYTKTIQKPIILVTGDEKEDWWRIFNGQKLGPRTELIDELNKHSNVSLLLYTPDRFIELSNKYLRQKVAVETIEEVKDVIKRHGIQQLYGDTQNLLTNSNTISAFSKLIEANKDLLKMNNSSEFKNLSVIADSIRDSKFAPVYLKLAEEVNNIQRSLLGLSYNPAIIRKETEEELTNEKKEDSSL